MASKSSLLLKPFDTKSLRRFLQDDLATLQQSPILLVMSEPATNNVSLVSAVADSTKWVQFTLSQQLGLRIVPATVSSAYGTVQELSSRLDLLRRTGASSIVAVGSGAAMDSAKALARQKNDTVEHLILVPSTFGAAIAAGASHSLLLDSAEETLIPSVGDDIACPITVAPLEARYTADMDSSIVIGASLAIVFDACLRTSRHALLDDVLQDLHQLCRAVVRDERASHDTLMDLCYRTGNLLSFGLGSEDRSAPLALAASLIPPLFPHVHIVHFWASLLPGIIDVLESSSSFSSLSMNPKILELVAVAKTMQVPKFAVADENLADFSVPDMALSHIQGNSALWKSYDLPNQVLTEILRKSLLPLSMNITKLKV